MDSGNLSNSEGDMKRCSICNGAVGEKHKTLAGIANVINGIG